MQPVVAPPVDPAPVPVHRPDWRLIAVFYGVALGWVSLVALGLYLVGANMSATSAQLVFQLSVAFLYMPAPLVAGLIAERVCKRKPLIRTTFAGFGRKLPRLMLSYAGISIATFLAMAGLALLLGNLLHLPGAGDLVTSQAGLKEHLTTLFNEMAKNRGAAAPSDAMGSIPPIALLYLLAPLTGITAGLTINGLFAFGEEYGWRGFLMDELRPLGGVKANLLTGVLWGLWHGPIILMGYNFAPYNVAGVFMMCAICTSLAFLFWRARQYTDSLLAPAMLHGAFNGYGGFFLLLMVSRNPLLSVPVGLLGAVAVGIVAAVFWKWSAGRLAESPSA
jgi:membrane protease YdiL (CAAX protease family)